MNKPVILYLIRAEADLERIVSIAIPGKKYADQHIIYFGDTDYDFRYGIKNKVQKALLEDEKIIVSNAISHTLVGKLLIQFSRKSYQLKVKNYFFTLNKILTKILEKLVSTRKDKIAKKIFDKIGPDVFISDYSSTKDESYFPKMMRDYAKKNNIEILIIPHGPAGALHGKFSSYKPRKRQQFSGGKLCISSSKDFFSVNRETVVTGDPALSEPFIIRKNSIKSFEIDFYNHRKNKIAFIVALPKETTVSGWSIMEEIILDYSDDENVAMTGKIHPRMYSGMDTRTVENVNNFRMYGPEVDISLLVKWADIIICADHCSTLFEPMIMNKKVVAVRAHKARSVSHIDSPIHKSDPTINSITTSREFDIENLSNYTTDRSFIDEYCWGGKGPVDLGEKIFTDILLK